MTGQPSPLQWAIAGQVTMLLSWIATIAFGPIVGALVGMTASVLVGAQCGRAARAMREGDHKP